MPAVPLSSTLPVPLDTSCELNHGHPVCNRRRNLALPGHVPKKLILDHVTYLAERLGLQWQVFRLADVLFPSHLQESTVSTTIHFFSLIAGR